MEWSAEVAEPQEMLPWIRGWGADVEVIEPTELRDEMIREAKRLAKRYGLFAAQKDSTQPTDFEADGEFDEFFGG